VSVAETAKGAGNADLDAFLDYLKGDAAAKIFADHGWKKTF